MFLPNINQVFIFSTLSIFTEIHPVEATLIRVDEWKKDTLKLSAFHDYMNMPKKFYVNEHQYNENFSWMHWKSIPQINNIQSLNMMDLVLRCNKFYEKQDMKMGFAATCLSTGKVFIHALEGLSVSSVHNTEEVQMVGEILGLLRCYAV